MSSADKGSFSFSTRLKMLRPSVEIQHVKADIFSPLPFIHAQSFAAFPLPKPQPRPFLVFLATTIDDPPILHDLEL